jgi:hypothetical protein
MTDGFILVLHPCLRSHWFAATADSEEPVAQGEAIKTAEIIFRYIAESYLEAPTTTVLPPKPPPKLAPRTASFLASACAFQRPTTATTATTILKRTPQEELADELDRYLRFEIAPAEGDHGGPSAEEVLLNPLLWWKVSILFTTFSLIINLIISCMRLNSQPLPGWRGTISQFLQPVSRLNVSFPNPDTSAVASEAP